MVVHLEKVQFQAIVTKCYRLNLNKLRLQQEADEEMVGVEVSTRVNMDVATVMVQEEEVVEFIHTNIFS